MPQWIKALTIPAALRQIIVMLKAHLGVLVSIAVLLPFPFALAFVFAAHALSVALRPSPTPEDIGALYAADWAIGGLVLVLQAVLLLSVLPVAHAAVVWALGHEYVGRPVGAWRSFRSAVRTLIPLILTNLLASLIFVCGCVIASFAGILFGWGTGYDRIVGDLLMLATPILCILPMFCYVFASYVTMIEGRYGWPALVRSAVLVWREKGTLLLLGLFLWFAVHALQVIGNVQGRVLSEPAVFVVYDLAMIGDIPGPLLSDLVGVVMWTALFIVSAAGSATIYFSARCRSEHFTEETLAEELEKRFTRPILKNVP